MNRLRALVVAVAATALWIVVPSTAAATSTTSDGPTRVNLASDASTIAPLTREVRATVTITTGPRPTKLSLEFSSFQFVRRIAGARIGEGRALRFMGLGVIKGLEGYFGTGGGWREPRVQCDSNSSTFAHGVPDMYQDMILAIPKHKTVSLELIYELAGDSPWLNTNYSPRVVVGPPGPEPVHYPNGPPSTRWNQFKDRKILSLAPPRVLLPLAGRVDFDFSPRPKLYQWLFGSVKAGKQLKVLGRIVPARANYPINLWANGKLLAATRTDATGQFSHPWLPRAGRTNYIRAEYPGGPGTDLLPDRGCEAAVEVERKAHGN